MSRKENEINTEKLQKALYEQFVRLQAEDDEHAFGDEERIGLFRENLEPMGMEVVALEVRDDRTTESDEASNERRERNQALLGSAELVLGRPFGPSDEIRVWKPAEIYSMNSEQRVTTGRGYIYNNVALAVARPMQIGA